MIPRVIHYCWFGRGELPPLAQRCIESWKRFMPGYEIREWNEDNFDVNLIAYTREAYEARKFAFVSDYARFYILYHHGGLYFDTDVELIRPMDDIVARGAFMGCENRVGHGSAATLSVAPGLGLGCPPRLALYAELLDRYSRLHFRLPDGRTDLTTVVSYTTDLLVAKGLRPTNELQRVAGVWIYPKEYFCPMDYGTHVLELTADTRSIHHYAASWHGTRHRLFGMARKLVGKRAAHCVSLLLKRIGLVR